jgi:hypothetical protein
MIRLRRPLGPILVDLLVSLLERALLRFPAPAAGATESGLPRDWVGPRLLGLLERRGGESWLVIEGRHTPHGAAHQRVNLRIGIQGERRAEAALERPGPFRLAVPLPRGTLSPVRVELEASPSFIPDDVLANGDRRELCFVLDSLRLAADRSRPETFRSRRYPSR